MEQTINIHGSAFVLGHHGVLVRGPSGAGKSLLIHTAIKQAQMLGQFAIWLGDDRLDVCSTNGAVLAKPATNLAGQAELRFLGIREHEHLPAARIDLIVELIEPDNLDRMPKKQAQTQIVGVNLPYLAVPRSDQTHALALIFQHFLP